MNAQLKSTSGDLRERLSPQSRAAITALAKPNPWRGTALYAVVWLAIAVAMVVEPWAKHPLVTIAAIIFIAGRQHSLYVLNHDASHYGLYRSHKTNKAVATVLSNLVMFHHPEAWSFVQWRRVHMLHHAFLFTERDPNYVGRALAGDTSQPISIGRLAVRCVKSAVLMPWQFFAGRQDYVRVRGQRAEKNKFNHLRTLLASFPDDPEMNRERWLKIIFFCVTLTSVAVFDLWRPLLLLWIVPMYTVYPMILTFHDLTEHRWTVPSKVLTQNCRSVRLGFVRRILVTLLPRGLHLEHHIFPKVIAFKLPQLSAILQRDHVIGPSMSFDGWVADIKNVESRHEYQS